MQITGGRLKGKKLAKCNIKTTRPAMALVRKSIFDTLKDFVSEKNVLDLCAGSGILGIEALSRGAKDLTLIDSDKNAIKLIRKNLDICSLKASVIRGNLPHILKKNLLKNKKYDLIFFDPPYGKSSFIEEVLNLLVKEDFLEKNGLILIESEAKSDFKIPQKLTIFKEKRYGNTKVTMLLLV